MHDEEIAEVRRIRSEISQECAHDVRKVAEYYREMGKRVRLSVQPGRDDWRATVGAFANDPIAHEIIDESLRLREDRRQVGR